MEYRQYLPLVTLIVLIIFLQLFLSLLGIEFFLKELTQSAYYTLVVLGLCLLMGYAGQISLGHAGFFAIGGYTSAVLTTFDFNIYASAPIVQFFKSMGILINRQDLYGTPLLTCSPWAAFILALVFTTLVALLIGIPVIRLKGHYLAMATLGFGVIILAIITATGLLGEHDPITKVPPFNLFLGLEVNGRLPFRIGNYYIAWFVVCLICFLIINLINSRIGRALRSIHGNEEAANSLGINTNRYKLYTFVVSAIFAAIAGVFLTHYNAMIGPSEVTVLKSVRYVAIVAVGGMSNLWGCVFMGVLLNFLSLRGFFGTFDDIVFGIILITIMLFAPQGLLNIPQLKNWLQKINNLLRRFKLNKAPENNLDKKE